MRIINLKKELLNGKSICSKNDRSVSHDEAEY